MHNYKLPICVCIWMTLSGCSDNTDRFFHVIEPENQTSKIEYSDIHRMNLAISEMSKSIDESGFSPSLNATFSLTNSQTGPWPQAWVAFIVNISIKDKLLASMTKSGSLHEHSLKVSVNQLLPKFGIKKDDINIEVNPISWMPTYPLVIQSAARHSP